jgi:hypothetical protein
MFDFTALLGLGFRLSAGGFHSQYCVVITIISAFMHNPAQTPHHHTSQPYGLAHAPSASTFYGTVLKSGNRKIFFPSKTADVPGCQKDELVLLRT